MWRGDIRLGDTLDLHFTTRAFSTGIPTTLAGTPVISAYPSNSTTQLTAGITLTVDLDGVAGLNQVRVAATGGNGYVTATNYALVITTGTVGGVSVVGEVVSSFSIEARSGLMPTTAARTLDVSAGGEAGVDWANVGTPGSTVGLTATTIGTLTTYTGNTVQTGDAFARLGAPAGASVSADILVIDNFVDDLETRLGTPSNLGSGATISANLVDIEGQTDDIGVAGAGLTAIDLPDQTMNITGNITGNLSGSVGSVTGMSAANITTGLIEVTAIKAKTDSLVFTVAGQVDSNIQSVNDVTVTGNGQPGNEWGP